MKMKYVAPKYELTVLETETVLSASGEQYEIEKKENGVGNVIMNAFDVFN